MKKRICFALLSVFLGILSLTAQTTALVPYEGGYFVKNGNDWTEYRPADKTGKWSTYKQYNEDDTFFYLENKKCRLAIPKLAESKIFIKRDKKGQWEVVYNTIDVHHQCVYPDGLFYCYQDGRGREHNGYYVRCGNGEWKEYAPGKKRGVWAEFKQIGEEKDYFIVESTQNTVKIPKKPSLNFVITQPGNSHWRGGYTTMAIYDRSAAYRYNFNYEYYGTLTKKRGFKAANKGARISFDNKGNLQIAFDGKHYDYVYTDVELVEVDGNEGLYNKPKEAVLFNIDRDNKVWLYDGNAVIDCKAVGKKHCFVGYSGKDYRMVAELLKTGAFRTLAVAENKDEITERNLPEFVEEEKSEISAGVSTAEYFNSVAELIESATEKIEKSKDIHEATIRVDNFRELFKSLKFNQNLSSMVQQLSEEELVGLQNRFNTLACRMEIAVKRWGLELGL